MGILKRLFGKNVGHAAKAKEHQERPPLEDILRENGLDVSMQELAAEYERIAKDIKVVKVLPEALWTSNIAELTFVGSRYRIAISVSVPDGDETIDLIFTRGCTYAAISELAKRMGVTQFEIRPEARIGVVGVSDHERHPLHSLL